MSNMISRALDCYLLQSLHCHVQRVVKRWFSNACWVHSFLKCCYMLLRIACSQSTTALIQNDDDNQNIKTLNGTQKHQPARSVSLSALLFLVVMIPICEDSTGYYTAYLQCNAHNYRVIIGTLPDWLGSGQSTLPQNTPSAIGFIRKDGDASIKKGLSLYFLLDTTDVVLQTFNVEVNLFGFKSWSSIVLDVSTTTKRWRI